GPSRGPAPRDGGADSRSRRRGARFLMADRTDLAFLGARQLAGLVRDRKVSPVELTLLYLERIERLDGRLRAYITVLPEAALASARRAGGSALGGGKLPALPPTPYPA